MNSGWILRLRVGLVAPLMAWMILAGISPGQGVTDSATVTSETSWAEEVIFLPMTMRHLMGTERVSIARDGTQGNDYSYFPSISSDGRYVAFGSAATNLVVGDSNGESDVFVYDRWIGITELVSVAGDGTQGNGRSSTPSISGDGRYVAFTSDASNLVSGDTNTCGPEGRFNCEDIFVHDRWARATERVSLASDGTQGNDVSYEASISYDGRYVAFYSYATNLVEGDTQLCPLGPLAAAQEINCADIFVHDRQTGVTARISVSGDGAQGNGMSRDPSISADGRYVAFDSLATNLVEGGTQECRPWIPAAPQDYCSQIFVHDRQSGVTELVSAANDGTQGNDASGNPSISADGRFVAFNSAATNLAEGDSGGLFVRDLQTGVTERVSVSSDGELGSGVWPSISYDGRYVLFTSSADNLVEGDTNEQQDVFVRDRLAGVTRRVSVASDGSQANDFSTESSISGDGRYIAFASYASNLVGDDTNGVPDVFVHWANDIR